MSHWHSDMPVDERLVSAQRPCLVAEVCLLDSEVGDPWAMLAVAVVAVQC